MKCNIYCFIALFLCFLGFSQTIVIKWEEEKSLQRFVGDNDLFPYFTNENYSLENTVPILNGKIENASFLNYEIINLKWVKIEDKDLFSISKNYLPTENQWNCSVSNGNLFYNILTFKIEKNILYKLVSFEIIGNNRIKKVAKILNFSESVLKSGDYYKLKIDKTGIYRDVFIKAGVCNVLILSP